MSEKHLHYSVMLWGSEPATNDDLWQAKDFESLEDAEATLKRLMDGDSSGFGHADFLNTQYIVLAEEVQVDASECTIDHSRWPGSNNCQHIVTKEMKKEVNPHFVESDDDDDDDWHNESRMQAGMGFGTQGYNDYEGYEEDYEPRSNAEYFADDEEDADEAAKCQFCDAYIWPNGFSDGHDVWVDDTDGDGCDQTEENPGGYHMPKEAKEVDYGTPHDFENCDYDA